MITSIPNIHSADGIYKYSDNKWLKIMRRTNETKFKNITGVYDKISNGLFIYSKNTNNFVEINLSLKRIPILQIWNKDLSQVIMNEQDREIHVFRQDEGINIYIYI